MSESIIVKTTYVFTVLHRRDEPFLEGQENSPFDNELGEAMRRSWDGHAVGSIVDQQTVAVPNEQVPDELGDLGNDGSFFNEDLNAEGEL